MGRRHGARARPRRRDRRVRDAEEAAVADYRAVTYRRGTVDQARFAPDGQTIVYAAQWEGKPPQLYSTRADSTETAALPFPSAFLSAISSSGKLALALDRDSGPTLAEASLAGGAPREILEGSLFADWSPDGRGLAVIRNGKLEFPIGKVLGTPGELAALLFPRFSPDGREIAAIESLRAIRRRPRWSCSKSRRGGSA